MWESELNHSVIEKAPLKICLLNTVTLKAKRREGRMKRTQGLFIKNKNHGQFV